MPDAGTHTAISAATELHSDSFRIAVLRSERIRIIGLLVILLLLTVFTGARCLVVGGEQQWTVFVRGMVILGIALAYELAMLLAVRRQLRSGRDMSPKLWITNVVLETLLPAIGLAMASHGSIYGPFRALTSPILSSYFLFIILSTLRLRPRLCLLTGAVAALSYGSILAFNWLRYASGPLASQALPLHIYVTYGVLLLLGGLAAAGVAHEIRKHVLIAIAEARRMERIQRDLSIARSIQRGLLPQDPPAIPGYDVSGWAKPADHIGGDYFDWLTLPDGRTIISIADVTGHGIGPALIVSVCRAYFRAITVKNNTLEETIWRVNQLLAYELPVGSFITAAVGIMEPSQNTMRLFSAGHGPILFYRAATDSVELVPADDLPLGLMEEEGSGRTARSIDFAPHDILVLTTDGFFEWANVAGERFGIERLEESIRTKHHLSPEELIQELYHDVLRFADGTTQADDVTAVVVKRQ